MQFHGKHLLHTYKVFIHVLAFWEVLCSEKFVLGRIHIHKYAYKYMLHAQYFKKWSHRLTRLRAARRISSISKHVICSLAQTRYAIFQPQ